MYNIFMLELEVKKSYLRFSPKEEDRTPVTIQDETELAYHKDLQASGYRYEKATD